MKQEDIDRLPTASQVNSATRKQIEGLIADAQLEIKPDDFSTVAELKAAVNQFIEKIKSEPAKETPGEKQIDDGKVRYEVALRGNQTRIVRTWPEAPGQAIMEYNKLMGITATEHQHIVSQLDESPKSPDEPLVAPTDKPAE